MASKDKVRIEVLTHREYARGTVTVILDGRRIGGPKLPPTGQMLVGSAMVDVSDLRKVVNDASS